MKNKTRCLSLLLFVPLLAGCGNKLSEPKFAKFGDEVKADKFQDEIEKKLKDASFSKKAKLGSLECTQKTGQSAEKERTRDGKQYSKSENSSVMDVSMKYDSEQLSVLSETEMVMSSKSEGPGSHEESEFKVTAKVQMQHSKVKKENWFVSVDLEENVYEGVQKIEKKDLATMLDGQAKGMVSQTVVLMKDALLGYDGASKEEKKNFKFYQNGSIFTMEYKTEDSENEKEYSVKYNERNTVQLDLTQGKWSFKSYTEVVETTEFKKDFDEFYKGEVYNDKTVAVTELSFAKKNVKVNPLDLSKYEAKGF